MPTTLNRSAYEQLIAENLEWLAKQPRTLEREHIEQIVKHSADHEYGTLRVVEALRKEVERLRAALAESFITADQAGEEYRHRLEVLEEFARQHGYSFSWAQETGEPPVVTVSETQRLQAALQLIESQSSDAVAVRVAREALSQETAKEPCTCHLGSFCTPGCGVGICHDGCPNENAALNGVVVGGEGKATA